MKVELDIGEDSERGAVVFIRKEEIGEIFLEISNAGLLNRTDNYYQRHDSGSPNSPERRQSYRVPIGDYIKSLKGRGVFEEEAAAGDEGAKFEPVTLIVPISDLIANLFRPAFHIDIFGGSRIFHFADEPLSERSYFAICFFKRGDESNVELKWVRFDSSKDLIYDMDNNDLVEEGLVWAAAITPLIDKGKPLSIEEIAFNSYDLRHIFGRERTEIFGRMKSLKSSEWKNNIKNVIEQFEKLAYDYSVFYHSIFCLDRSGNIIIYQMEGNLKDIPAKLAEKGIEYGGILDSGGSCAIFDPWIGGFLNHGWYYREKRGAVLIFKLKSKQRIPDKAGYWIDNRIV